MRVLLLQSPLGRRRYRHVYPYGLCCLASVLKNHEVRVIDPNVLPDAPQAVERMLAEWRPDVIGVSLRNIDTERDDIPWLFYVQFKEFVAAIRRSAPGTPLVVGGTGFSMFPWEVMERSPEIDLGVFLDAEECFPELLENLGRPETVAGVFYRKDGQVLRTGCRTPPNVSKMPAIDMSFVDLAGYTAFPYNMGVQTKRGCILDCAYCSYPALNGRQLRLREPGQVVDEIDELVTRYGLKTLSFLDSVFNIPQEHCVAICQELIRRRVSVKWYAWFNCREFSEDLFALALRAGCEIFCFSPDAYTARGLEALQKQLCRQDIRRIVKMFERYRGPARLSFNFFGSFPGMRLPDLLRTLAFSMEARARLRGRLHAVGIEHIRILPGTAVHRLAMEKGVITPETNLLPENVDDYGKLFYREPNAWFADFLFRKFHVASEKWFG